MRTLVDQRLHFPRIKQAYKDHLPRLLKEYPRWDPYFFDFMNIMTPIEYNVWTLIRQHNLPFLYQFPYHQYMLDFADPVKRIVIEADGKEYHNSRQDSLRDKNLTDNLWTVLRLPGKTTYRDFNDYLDSEGEDVDDMELEEKQLRWGKFLHETAEAQIENLARQYYPQAIGLHLEPDWEREAEYEY